MEEARLWRGGPSNRGASGFCSASAAALGLERSGFDPLAGYVACHEGFSEWPATETLFPLDVAAGALYISASAPLPMESARHVRLNRHTGDRETLTSQMF